MQCPEDCAFSLKLAPCLLTTLHNVQADCQPLLQLASRLSRLQRLLGWGLEPTTPWAAHGSMSSTRRLQLKLPACLWHPHAWPWMWTLTWTLQVTGCARSMGSGPPVHHLLHASVTEACRQPHARVCCMLVKPGCLAAEAHDMVT